MTCHSCPFCLSENVLFILIFSNNILKQNGICGILHPGQAGQGGVWCLRRGSGVCWRTAEVWSNPPVPTTDLQLQMTRSAEPPQVCLYSTSTHSEELNPNTESHLMYGRVLQKFTMLNMVSPRDTIVATAVAFTVYK